MPDPVIAALLICYEQVENPKDIDHGKLLLHLHDRFSTSFIKWKRQSKFFKCTNLLVTLLIVAVQVAQVCLCCDGSFRLCVDIFIQLFKQILEGCTSLELSWLSFIGQRKLLVILCAC